MADSIKDKVAGAGQAVADTAKGVGHAIAEGAGKAADAAKGVGHAVADGAAKAAEFVKEKAGLGDKACSGGFAAVKERMDVIASCGKKVGVVDHVEGGCLKLTKNDSPDGQHHFIPAAWVDHVDSHVHLNKDHVETQRDWKPDAASCGCA